MSSLIDKVGQNARPGENSFPGIPSEREDALKMYTAHVDQKVREADSLRASGVPDMKHDDGKVDWTVLMDGFPDALREVLAVYLYGMQKYERGSWKTIDVDRWKAAVWRHTMDLAGGEIYDKESGLRHEAHITAGKLIILQLTDHDANYEFNPPPVPPVTL